MIGIKTVKNCSIEIKEGNYATSQLHLMYQALFAANIIGIIESLDSRLISKNKLSKMCQEQLKEIMINVKENFTAEEIDEALAGLPEDVDESIKEVYIQLSQFVKMEGITK